MKIERIRTYHLCCPLPEPFAFSQWRYDERHQLLVQIVTDAGAEGWGECYGPSAVAQAAISTFYGPLLLGRDALQIDRLWELMWRRSLDYARRGMMMAAISGIDMALWDLQGRVLGRSVSELMGGARRDAVPCYATGMYFRDRPEPELLDELVDEAIGYWEQGFTALKIKIGKHLTFDREIIRRVRRALPDARLMADANHAYDLPEATAIGHLLADEGYAWFEEPLSPEHPEQFRQLSDRVPVPLATGECEQTRWGFQSLLAPRGVAIAQPDLAYCGGPSEALKIRAIAGSLGVNVVPHAWGTQLGLAAALHFLATDDRQPGRAEPATGVLERDCTVNPLRDTLFSTPLSIERGTAAVPTLPGLGVTVDLPAMRQYCVAEQEVA